MFNINSQHRCAQHNGPLRILAPHDWLSASQRSTPVYSSIHRLHGYGLSSKGIVLVPSSPYTLLVIDNVQSTEVTGWVVPSLVDFNQVGSE